MDDRSTFGDATESRVDLVATLAVVLHYDDLLAGPGRSFRIGRADTFTLGRASREAGEPTASEGALLFGDRWVSTTHAILRKRPNGAYFIEDGGSRNGTYVNGERVEHPQRIFDGDLIEVGHTLLCFREVPEDLAGSLEDPDDLPVLGPTRTRCPQLVALVRDLEKIARSRQAVLLLGETGVGKEVVARSVHDRSQRSGAFCAVDCGAVPESLFEGTFFGHRRGAFTGAAEARTGEIVRAHGGTLFLDEVSNMSLACQAKLLRVLEEGKVTALGASEAQVVDVRWIAATNADPFARGAAFRPDLLQRLASFIARLPPLRRRREDLGALAAHFLSEAGARKASITAAGARRLFGDPFEGNVRQLRSMLQTAVLLAADSPIDLAHLPAPGETDDGEALEEASRDDGPRLRQTSAPLGQGPTAAPDVATLESALEKTGGNVIRAAEALDVRPRQLYRWIARFGLPLDKYRSSK